MVESSAHILFSMTHLYKIVAHNNKKYNLSTLQIQITNQKVKLTANFVTSYLESCITSIQFCEEMFITVTPFALMPYNTNLTDGYQGSLWDSPFKDGSWEPEAIIWKLLTLIFLAS